VLDLSLTLLKMQSSIVGDRNCRNAPSRNKAVIPFIARRSIRSQNRAGARREAPAERQNIQAELLANKITFDSPGLEGGYE
jgi:hypothetical protein